MDGLLAKGIPIALFVFKNSEKSHCARKEHDGNVKSVPCLRLFLRFNEDLVAQGSVAKLGNWSDCWPMTDQVRELLNDRIAHYGFPSTFHSENTLITLDSLERLALLQIGKDCKPLVKSLLEREIPSLKIDEIYWNSARHFTAVTSSECPIKRIPKKSTISIQKSIQKILRSADVEGNCKDYYVTVELKPAKANLFHDVREDV
jgi:hypothetical protein